MNLLPEITIKAPHFLIKCHCPECIYMVKKMEPALIAVFCVWKRMFDIQFDIYGERLSDPAKRGFVQCFGVN